MAFVRNSADTGFTEVFRASRYLRIGTNNVAEAHACLLALTAAYNTTTANVNIKGDCRIITDIMSDVAIGKGVRNLDQRPIHIAIPSTLEEIVGTFECC